MESDDNKPAIDTRHTPRSLRARLELTQREVAARADVTEKTLSELESGEDVTLETIRSVAKALDVTPDVLIAAHEVERGRRAGKGAA